MRYDLGRLEILKHGGLPHWNAEHAVYFITFNLHGAIPKHVLLRIQLDVEHMGLTGDIAAAATYAKVEAALDDAANVRFMGNPQIASIVAAALTHFDNDRYQLLAWCVMPSHVHVVASLFDSVDRVVHSWKSFTAKRCNALLQREGSFWQEGYFDRCMRSSEELARTIEYVANNPIKAGLREWPFVCVYGDRIAGLEARPPVRS